MLLFYSCNTTVRIGGWWVTRAGACAPATHCEQCHGPAGCLIEHRWLLDHRRTPEPFESPKLAWVQRLVPSFGDGFISCLGLHFDNHWSSVPDVGEDTNQRCPD